MLSYVCLGGSGFTYIEDSENLKSAIFVGYHNEISLINVLNNLKILKIFLILVMHQNENS